ncbi:MAG TPA: hypothetical protein VKB51_03300 [bacterium]|nr:hypothetical protein [bacterium]
MLRVIDPPAVAALVPPPTREAPEAPPIAPIAPAGAAPSDTSVPRTIRESEAAHVRREAIGIHLAFAHMHPLIRRTRHLSLNAILASARLSERGQPFSIVAQELNTVAADLDTLVGDIERMFRELVVGIARWGKAELRLDYVRRSQALLAPRAEAEPTAYEATPGASTTTRETQARQAHLTAALADQAQRLQALIAGELDAIDVVTGKLSGRIDRINWVAVRQCHYTSISAQIEAAQLSDTSTGLASVAGDIRALADDIAAAERQAKERAIGLRYLLKTRLPRLIQQVRHA